MSSTVFTVFYHPLLVELKSYTCYDGVTVIEMNDEYIKVQVEELHDGERKEIMCLTFVTSDYAPFGDSDIMEIASEDTIFSNLAKLTIYQIGDVNMDGDINIDDATMIQKYAVRKLALDSVQKAYANVNGDLNADGSAKINTVDAAMVQRYAAKKIDGLGDRITISFVEGERCFSLTLIRGKEVNYPPIDGYAWSLSKDQYISVDFTALTSDTTVYMIEQWNKQLLLL
jgi:hypothetical protein